MDVTRLDFSADSFDGIVATFLVCVLPDDLQGVALRELGRVVKAGWTIRLLVYVRPHGSIRRIMAAIWEPWMRWASGAGFDRRTEQHIPEAGLELVEARYVVDDLLKLLVARVRK
jgi:SAM-dependent methyltransferase